ncbi:glycerate kinase [Nocardioides bruguierae]|uniref:glycerate kinase n=1 Tax=Nocardioides bruguierae TaxID=2945102 RepID=UPI0020201025|nr:glycerate kinase [Nocardioides bruguierae]MCL8026823.1 glycerate kinase [Nocardioides bruguierae]
MPTASTGHAPASVPTLHLPGRQGRPLRVLACPDSFKTSLSAADAARALADGWRTARPGDAVTTLPVADGGEGTVEALALASGTEPCLARVSGPHGSVVEVPWLLLEDGTAVVELAAACGLGLMRTLDPLGADTQPLGELLAHVLDAGARRVLVGLGGSASTDGGTGALRALGARLTGPRGHVLPRGGGSLPDLSGLDVTDLRPPPPDGVHLLTDVDSPLVGPDGAAHVFGPQKGAGPTDVALLERGLRRLREVVGEPDTAGDGAAGGTGYGLRAIWGATSSPGAAHVLEAAGFARALADCDVVLTGEGSFDAQSLAGKIVGQVVDAARREGRPCVVVAGRVAGQTPATSLSLSDLAGSSTASLGEPARWLREAAAALGRGVVTG